MSTQTGLYVLTMNIKKTVNISPPPKAHDRPYSKGWIEPEGQITEELLIPALETLKKISLKVHSITVMTNYSTQQQSDKFSFETDELSFHFLFRFILSCMAYIFFVSSSSFICLFAPYIFMFLSQD